MLQVSPLRFRAGTMAGRLLEPYSLPPHLTGAVYHDFLHNSLPELLQDVDLQTGSLTLILLTWRIRWAPNNASKWQMGFNSAFKGLMIHPLWCCTTFYGPCILVLHHIYGSSMMMLHHINVSCIMVLHHIYGPCILVLHHICGSHIMVFHHIYGPCILVLQHMWFMHYGPPTHFLFALQQ